MSTTWYDSEYESEEDTTNKVMNFTGKYEFDSESSDEDISGEELAEMYKLLYIKWKEACRVGENQKKAINVLL